jgi:hypothetical protein
MSYSAVQKNRGKNIRRAATSAAKNPHGENGFVSLGAIAKKSRPTMVVDGRETNTTRTAGSGAGDGSGSGSGPVFS